MRISEIMGEPPAIRAREKVNKAAHAYADRKAKAAERERAAMARPPGPARSTGIQSAQRAAKNAADTYGRQLRTAHATQQTAASST